MQTIDFTGKVAIVSGGGTGLGREYCLELARRGAAVVVNDLGVAMDGTGASDAARQTAEDIVARGGRAIANGASVTDMADMEAMTEQAIAAFGRIDFLVANAGILRDRSFAKLPIEDFDAVVDVHLGGTARAIKAVWAPMVAQGFGRIVVTTSSAGLFGNFGQTNYAAAKLGIVGMMNTLKIEGQKHGIRINCISPFAVTRMTAHLVSAAETERMDPKYVAQGVAWLCSEDAPTGTILNAGAGFFSTVRVTETRGHAFPRNDATAEAVGEMWSSITATEGEATYASAREHGIDMRARRIED